MNPSEGAPPREEHNGGTVTGTVKCEAENVMGTVIAVSQIPRIVTRTVIAVSQVARSTRTRG